MCFDSDEQDITILHTERNLFYTLGDPDEILGTYLSLTPHKYLHPNGESEKNLKSIPIRIILSEITYNNSLSSLMSSLSGLISGIPMMHFDKKKFCFKGALIIGPFYLEFTDTSLCIPKKITPQIRELFDKIQPIAISDLKLSAITKKLSKVVCEWNTTYSYVPFDYIEKIRQGNCFSFIEKVLSALNVKPKFNGALGNFLREMKEFGDSNANIYPSIEFEKKFNFQKMQNILDHLEFDDTIFDIFEIDPDVAKNHPHDYAVLQAIDCAFWMRFIFTNEELYEPMMDHHVSLCPCFKKKLFDKIPIESWKNENELKKSLRRRKSSVKLKISSSDSLVKKKKLRLDFDTPDDVEYFRKYCEEKLMIEYFLYYELYIKYIEEENLEEKYKIGKKIYDEFIVEDSKHQIYLSKKLLTKVKNFCKTDSTRGFQMVYKEVCSGLQPAYEKFINTNYKEQFIKKEIKEINTPEISIPSTFKELMDSKEEFQLFVKYTINSFGRDYIECFNDIVEYEKTKNEQIIMETQRTYCKKFGNHCVVQNPALYETIMKDGLFNDESMQILKNQMYKILDEEYYPRFIHSQMWKDHIHVTLAKQKDSKFEHRYDIVQKEKEEKSLTETQLLTVKHKLTGENFKAKKVVSSKAFLSKQSLEHENLLKLIDIFHEDITNTFDTSSMVIVTNNFDESLKQYLDKSTEYISQIFILGYFRELLSAVEELSKSSKHFDEGELTEDNVYVSTDFDKIYIDPGFYTELNEIPSYLQPPESEISEKSDVYMLGFLFVRMISLLSIEKIQELYNNTPKYGDVKSTSTTAQNLIDEIKKLKTEYAPSILNLILDMIEPNPSARPSLSDLVNRFSLIYQKLTRESPRNESMSLIELDSQKKLLLKDDLQRRYLKAWARSEYSTESVLFYEDVVLFSKLTSNQERYSKAIEIFQSYLYTSSDLEINISGELKKKIASEIEHSRIDGFIADGVFDELQNHVVQTLFVGGFVRFTLGAIGAEWKEFRNNLLKEKKRASRRLSIEMAFDSASDIREYEMLPGTRTKLK